MVTTINQAARKRLTDGTAEQAWKSSWAKTEPIQASKILQGSVFGLRKGSGHSGSPARWQEIIVRGVFQQMRYHPCGLQPHSKTVL